MSSMMLFRIGDELIDRGILGALAFESLPDVEVANADKLRPIVLFPSGRVVYAFHPLRWLLKASKFRCRESLLKRLLDDGVPIACFRGWSKFVHAPLPSELSEKLGLKVSFDANWTYLSISHLPDEAQEMVCIAHALGQLAAIYLVSKGVLEHSWFITRTLNLYRHLSFSVPIMCAGYLFVLEPALELASLLQLYGIPDSVLQFYRKHFRNQRRYGRIQNVARIRRLFLIETELIAFVEERGYKVFGGEADDETN